MIIVDRLSVLGTAAFRLCPAVANDAAMGTHAIKYHAAVITTTARPHDGAVGVYVTAIRSFDSRTSPGGQQWAPVLILEKPA